MDKSRSDENLMLAYRDGDADAFETLYRRHKGALYRYLLRQCGHAANAEELFQDVWINLIKARERYEVRAKFKTYLFTLAHNRLIDHFRRRGGNMAADNSALEEAPAADPSTQPDRHLDTKRRVRRLLEMIERLPNAQRETFLLREEAGLTLEEIAMVTRVGVEAAKSRLRYALAKLKQGMGDLEA